MAESDQWGDDPNVRMMRRIFILMEESQKELLMALKISPFDPKLRRVRDRARNLFEQTWPIASQNGIVANESEVTLLYRYCLSHALKWSGVKVSGHRLSESDKIARFLQEKVE